MTQEHTYVVSGGTFFPPGSPAIEYVRNQLKFKNPAYYAAKAMQEKGRRVPLPDPFIYGCETIPAPHPWAGGLMAPRGYSPEDNIKSLKFKRLERYAFNDAAPLVLAPDMAMRDYQSSAVSMFKKFGTGYVVAPTGAGKTTIGMGVLVAVATKACILVHTHDLAKQWQDRCGTQLRTKAGGAVDVTIYSGSKKDDSGRVVIATMQTLARMKFHELHEWGKQFGMVIADECHHIPASTFSYVMFGMSARYRLGLTATPERHDGLTELMPWHLGLCLKNIELGDLARRRLILQPDIRFIHTGWYPDKEHLEWAHLINAMTADGGRNAIIIDQIKDMVDAGKQVLVLSDRVDHCRSMAEALTARGCPASELVGEMTKKERGMVLHLAATGKLKVIIATSLADEGLDLPGLDVAVLCVPTKAKGRLQQRIGRIMRFKDGKAKPIVLDIVDGGPAFKSLARRRRNVYHNLGCTITNEP